MNVVTIYNVSVVQFKIRVKSVLKCDAGYIRLNHRAKCLLPTPECNPALKVSRIRDVTTHFNPIPLTPTPHPSFLILHSPLPLSLPLPSPLTSPLPLTPNLSPSPHLLPPSLIPYPSSSPHPTPNPYLTLLMIIWLTLLVIL